MSASAWSRHFARCGSCPTINGPRVFGNAWPAYFHGWEDQLAQQEMATDLREQLERARNRTRLLPSSIDIARMETAIGWPGRYLLDCPQLIRAVQVAVFGRSHYRDLEWAARRLELPAASCVAGTMMVST